MCGLRTGKETPFAMKMQVVVTRPYIIQSAPYSLYFIVSKCMNSIRMGLLISNATIFFYEQEVSQTPSVSLSEAQRDGERRRSK